MASPNLRIVRLSWTANVGERFAGFAVDRSANGGTAWTRRTSVLLMGSDPYTFEEEIPAGAYLYRIVAVSDRDYERAFDPIAVSWSDGGQTVPVTSIVGPFPNPSRGRFEIRYALAEAGHVRIQLYDLSGRARGVLHEAQEGPGSHTWAWQGEPLTSGIYLLQIETGAKTTVAKLAIGK